MKRVLIRVTEKHIAENSHLSNSCPVALAIIEKIGSEVSVVPYNVIFFGFPRPYGEGSFTSVFSIRATRWIRQFDKKRKKSLKPFNFYLQVPETLTHAPS